VLLAQDGARQVVGVDRDPAAIGRARTRAHDRGLTWICGDALAPGLLPGPFSAVVSFETIEHLAAPDTLLARFREALDPDGLLVISTPNGLLTAPLPGWPPANPYHVWEESPAAFEARLQRAGFRILGCYGQTPLSAPARAALRLARARGQVLRRARLEALERVCRALEPKLADLLVGRAPGDATPSADRDLTQCLNQVYVCRRA
jgi:SAM-dependent methyltransferase